MVFQRRFDKNLGLRQPVGGEIVIREGARLICIVEENHRPGTFHVSLGLDQLRRRAPHRHHVAIHERLHRGDQGVEVDPERRRRLVEARDGGNSSLVECAERRSCSPHKDLPGKCRGGCVRMLRPEKKTVKRASERGWRRNIRSEEHTSELQSRLHLVCRLLLEKKKNKNNNNTETTRT